jgi:ribonucleoside-diphosphate reductase alpha subunit
MKTISRYELNQTGFPSSCVHGVQGTVLNESYVKKRTPFFLPFTILMHKSDSIRSIVSPIDFETHSIQSNESEDSSISQNSFKMFVEKRNGRKVRVNFQNVAKRLKSLMARAPALLPATVDVDRVSQRVIGMIADGMKTSEIDGLLATTLIGLQSIHPDHGVLSSRVVVSSLHKETPETATKAWDAMGDVLNDEFKAFVHTYGESIDEMIDHDRDYLFDYFGISTMMKLYCSRINGRIMERPQYVYARVAAVVCGYDMNRFRDMYDILSTHKAIFGSPTLFNSGMKIQQCASCFLLKMDDSIDGIFQTFSDMAKVSKNGGGIGVHIGDIRSRGSKITSTNGSTDGVVPMLKVLNSIATYVNQSNKRKGAIAAYIDVHHPDVLDVIELRRPGGEESTRARDIFTALMINDLFMKRVEEDGTWSFFDSKECPGLTDNIGVAYEELYKLYENDGKARKTMRARDVMKRICVAQIESGVPYIIYKDAANKKSNQKNIGVLKTSNLCAEILEYTDPGEISVCTLGSICLPKYIQKDGTLDITELRRVTKIMTRALDTVIDKNSYPTDKASRSNIRHRPIGLGLQGLYDALISMRVPFDSDDAVSFSERVSALIYHASISESVCMAKEKGAYETFEGSPASNGLLQYDLWERNPWNEDGSLDWEALKRDIREYGLRNSLNIAIMPTASTAQICGNVEACEPITSLYYVRRTLAGEFPCLYGPLVNELIERGLWTDDMRQKIIMNEGSIQNIDDIPDDMKDLYKNAYDIKQKWIIDHASARGAYVCQSQSMNTFFTNPSVKQIQKCHTYAWKKGLKTGQYYLRGKAAATGKKLLSAKSSPSVSPVEDDKLQCSLLNKDACMMCSG